MAHIWCLTQYTIYDDPRKIGDLETLELYVKAVLVRMADVWVAECRGHVVGFMAIRFAHISQLHVLPHWQHRGIGKQLLSIAKTNSPDLITLYCYREKLGRFYEGQGFRETRVLDQNNGNSYVEYQWRSRNILTEQEVTTDV